MARPEEYTDLPERERLITLLTIHSDQVGLRPYVAAAVAEMLKELESVGCQLHPEYGATIVKAAARPAQLSAALSAAQSAWDSAAELYEKVIRGEEVKDYQRDIAKRWAEREGREDPTVTRIKNLRDELGERQVLDEDLVDG